jgi:hypothetical protein
MVIVAANSAPDIDKEVRVVPLKRCASAFNDFVFMALDVNLHEPNLYET